MVEDWRPTATVSLLEKRAQLLRELRVFMEEHGIMEVETPILGRTGNPDPALHSFTTMYHSPASDQPQQLYLQTSPEFAMKRLLAAGSGSIYQITKVFRNNEAGNLHQPEFTMLEWYRTGFDHQQLMDEVAKLLSCLKLGNARKQSYQALFRQYTGLNPHDCDLAELIELATVNGLAEPEQDRKTLLEFLFNRLLSRNLGHDTPVFVYDYPECHAALASIRYDKFPLAERFELFINGMEIANGFNELRDFAEQEKRFATENSERLKRGLPEIRLDMQLLGALKAGLPPCAGVAVGLDRLLMALSGSTTIRDIMAFPIDHL